MKLVQKIMSFIFSVLVWVFLIALCVAFGVLLFSAIKFGISYLVEF